MRIRSRCWGNGCDQLPISVDIGRGGHFACVILKLPLLCIEDKLNILKIDYVNVIKPLSRRGRTPTNV